MTRPEQDAATWAALTGLPVTSVRVEPADGTEDDIFVDGHKLTRSDRYILGFDEPSGPNGIYTVS